MISCYQCELCKSPESYAQCNKCCKTVCKLCFEEVGVKQVCMECISEYTGLCMGPECTECEIEWILNKCEGEGCENKVCGIECVKCMECAGNN